MKIEERNSTHVYKQLRMFTKEELEAVEGLCVHEQPPYCNAACPLKLDTKALIMAVSQGDYMKALQLYEKITPFPHILSAGCEAPCKEKCKLCQLGEGIEIKEIERAAVKFGEKPKGRGLLRFKKKKTAAIFGSGLFCAFLAGELSKKAYPVTIFCEEKDETEFLSKEADFMGEEGLAADVAALKAMELDFRFGTELTAENIITLREGFDVVCASKKCACTAYPQCISDEKLMYDRENKLIWGETCGVLSAAFGAKKAALSLDRLAQNLDPNNSRGEEGTVKTELYTNTDGVDKLTAVPVPDGGYTREQAMEEAQRCIQCHCDECIKGCAYLQHYKIYPKVLTREIYNNVSIIMGDHMMNKPINACSLCGQCTVTCPNGYDMASVCKKARQNMVHTDKMPLAPHEFALLDMGFSNEEGFLSRPQVGYKECKYVFFPGCQATAIAPQTVRAAYEDLCRRLDGGVALMLGCCGAICDWAGREEMYEGVKDFIDRELGKLGDPVIIAGCPTCKVKLSEHENSKVIGIWDVLLELGLPEGAKSLPRPAALHDSCGARGDEQTQKAIREIAKRLGCELVDTEYSGDRSPCCGYGGLTAYANPEVAKEMTDFCLSRSDAPYISYCMACRDRFAREGRESRHILELVYGTDAGSPPDISEKRYNRLSLKNDMLREIWGEEVQELKLDFKLEFTDEAREMMDKRMILVDDVKQVMEQVVETGEAILDEESGLLIGRARIGNVTFWVKFTEIEGGYLVRRAYSHRMNIVKKA